MKTDRTDEAEAEAVLSVDPVVEKAREIFGVKYLYPYQRLAVHNILGACGLWEDGEADAAPGDQIILLPTGSGKSLCFQLPAAILPGITLVIYPLLSLMSDQKRRLDGANIASRVLRGGQEKAERAAVWAELAEGKVKLLITNPETLGGREVLRRCADIGVRHLVIDEAHCIAEWGQTFRPSYLELGKIRAELKPSTTTAFTATASAPILEGIITHLFNGKKPHIIAGNPDRPNISYRVIPVLSKDEALMEVLRQAEKPALVFCSSRKGTEMTARYLRRRLGHGEVFFYHAGLEREEKKAVEQWFFASGEGILCATCAYGMGVDKADIRTVIHRDIPGSVEAYLQESGRGGRDGKPAAAILLTGSRDTSVSRDRAQAPERRAAMLAYAHSTSCRRAFLLSLLGAQTESCEGCDVCEGAALRAPGEEKIILDFFRKNPRRFTTSEAALILCGARGARSLGGAYSGIRGFGSLSSWEEAGLGEAIEELLRGEKLKRHTGFLFRGKLAPRGRTSDRG
ncbi:MAG: RecQ family ATP-dependent DNA helicase [Spirochaetales bacterium]|jgi:ATP-dependent DNA helicase RecQ|nr:RecQ family ATP-dependent DNA helicase [Spirochaetales bacterium]